jgi:hypothetical protein
MFFFGFGLRQFHEITDANIMSSLHYEDIFRIRKTGRKRVIKARKRVAVRPQERASPSKITDDNTMSSLHCITTTRLFLG